MLNFLSIEQKETHNRTLNIRPDSLLKIHRKTSNSKEKNHFSGAGAFNLFCNVDSKSQEDNTV